MLNSQAQSFSSIEDPTAKTSGNIPYQTPSRMYNDPELYNQSMPCHS
jgi:hypothetical protein